MDDSICEFMNWRGHAWRVTHSGIFQCAECGAIVEQPLLVRFYDKGVHETEHDGVWIAKDMTRTPIKYGDRRIPHGAVAAFKRQESTPAEP